MITQLLKNWKTTSAGLLLAGGSIIHLIFSIHSKTADENTFTIAFASVVGGLGLMFAGDSNVPSPVTEKVAAEVDRINALGSDPNSKPLLPQVTPVPNPPIEPISAAAK